MLRYIFVITLIALGAFVIHTQPTKAERSEGYIVTTTAQIADIVENISAQDFIITHLMGSGVDPHLYRPTRSDVVKLRKADHVFYNGLHLEGQMVKLLDTLSAEKPVTGLAEHVSKSRLIHDGENYDGESAEQFDPHIWMDVSIWIEASATITQQLSVLNPANQDIYKQNAQRYEDKLRALDTQIKQSFATIPAEKRVLITAHDAFGYLGRAYDMEVIGVQGLSTESEAGLKRIEQLVDLIVEREIPAIFAETSVSDRNVTALIRGAKARGHDLKLGGSLYSDAMGAKGTPEGTYVGMISHNVSTITQTLGGTVMQPPVSLAQATP